MPRLTRIYTKTGDQGETSLGSGQRVPKNHWRIAAYGDVDETSSAIGVAIAHGLDSELATFLKGVQNDLFHVGSDLCFTEEDKKTISIPQIETRHVEKLEGAIDRWNEELGPLTNFILPGGSPGAAALHVARCVCRRAERSVVALRHHEATGAHVLEYLNRLSDLLFVAARLENKRKGVSDVYWDTKA
jgi:cob(I)alamin adenosyltransferase